VKVGKDLAADSGFLFSAFAEPEPLVNESHLTGNGLQQLAVGGGVGFLGPLLAKDEKSREAAGSGGYRNQQVGF